MVAMPTSDPFTPPRFDVAAVRHYYDRHTRAFVRYGQGGDLGAIHRAVWGPGTTTRREAFRYVEDRIAEAIRALQLPATSSRVPHVVDLGCGVGASLCDLAGRLPIRGTGITLSPMQARLGDERIRAAGLSDRVTCMEGDYCALPDGLDAADLAFAVESFVHGPDPALFFAECAHLVRPGGRLIICDDIRRSEADRHRTAARTIERFCTGWHVNTLIDRESLRTLAGDAGFDHESTADLTPHLEIGRPRDRAIDLLLTLFGWLPPLASRVDYLKGGSALQLCLARGWIGYDLAVFRRRGA
jgi:SAM-dependent methyltransferase